MVLAKSGCLDGCINVLGGTDALGQGVGKQKASDTPANEHHVFAQIAKRSGDDA